MTRSRERPLFVWDGDCGFCRFWVQRWKDRVGERVEMKPYQRLGESVSDLEADDFRRSAKLVEEDGSVHEGAAAIFRLLDLASAPGLSWWLYRHVGPFRRISEALYRAAARHRSLLGRATGVLWGREPPPHSFRATGWILGRGLALVYLVAFLSLAVQVRALVGSGGILPVGSYLEAMRSAAGSGPEAWLRAPTLAWLASGDAALLFMCGVGAAAALALFFELRPLISAAAAWLLYLSLVVAGQDFLSYQWDLLLVEAGFLGLFLVPAGRSPPERGAEPARDRRAFRTPEPWFPAVWLFWWLLFRLIVESGLAKLAGGDPVWRDLTAVAHHYETQPLPNVVAWFAHQLAPWIHRLSTLGTLVVELAVPFLFLLPRRPRLVGAAAVIGHQGLILVTGNYTFFNLLTIVLALSLLDDAAWRWLLSRAPGGERLLEVLDGEPRPPTVPRGWRRHLARAFLALAVAVGGLQALGSAGVAIPSGPLGPVRRALAPFRIVNGYGLFADMTTRRPEIVVEGRRGDGPWRELDFRFKPDDLAERPRQVAPHQPRLDWQMWFAALRAERAPPGAPPRVRYDRWLLRFVDRLLAGEPRVWGLLSPDGPFREGGEVRAPDRIRARLFDYRFTTSGERGRSGRWWSRTPRGLYLPPVRRGGSGLEIVDRGR